MWVAVATAVVGAIVGAVAGYAVRASEFRREQRLKVYGEFVGFFLDLAYSAAALQTAFMSLGATMFNDPDERERTQQLWDTWGRAVQGFETSSSRVRLIASGRVIRKMDAIENFVRLDVRAVRPSPVPPDTTKWGKSAQVGPAEVEREGERLARDFAAFGSGDLARRAWHWW